MVAGSVPIFDGPVSRYADRTGVPMLSVRYRPAPEHPHPVPVEDAYAGLTWLAGHAVEPGIDLGRIVVMGDSAGGGLAAGVTILSRETGRSRPVSPAAHLPDARRPHDGARPLPRAARRLVL